MSNENHTITAKLDVTMIEKARLFKGKKPNKNNVIPMYLDIVLVPRDDDYGNNFMVVQSVSKEERDKGVKGPILGNAKILGSRRQAEAGESQQPPPPPRQGDDVPF